MRKENEKSLIILLICTKHLQINTRCYIIFHAMELGVVVALGASDSHCVGSIPIAPANANTLTCESVLFFIPTAVLARAYGYKKKNDNRVKRCSR